MVINTKIKIALIYSFTPSAWVSCQSIVENLSKAYHFSDRLDILDINYSSDMSSFEEVNEIEKIKYFNPDKIVFIDHLPHPVDFLNRYKVLISEEIPDCIFHVFGDFTLNLNNWLKVKDLLNGSNAQFVCASTKQTKMITELLDRSYLTTIEFPVREDIFYFDEDERNKKRLLLGWEESKIILYTGRLSRQKNILETISEFEKFLKENEKNKEIKLVFVGDFDELGEPYKDRSEWKEEYFHEVYNLYLNLDPDIKEQIEFYPFQDSSELYQWYSAADYLVNLSTHNDEDFGMSCAEALFCSLPVVITNWAGFSSFKKLNGNNSVKYIDVNLNNNSKDIEFEAFQKILNNISSSVSERSDSSFIRNELSTKNISEKIEKLLESNAYTMNTSELLREASVLEQKFFGEVFYNARDRKYRDIYFSLYEHYASNK